MLEGTELGCWKRFAGTTITLTAAHYQLMFPSPRDERGGELIYPISRKRMVRDSSVTSSLLDRGNAKQQIPMRAIKTELARITTIAKATMTHVP